MANVKETPQWEDGIYQIEVSDPVLGGPDGISNKQAKQLANRTSWLKRLAESSIEQLAEAMLKKELNGSDIPEPDKFVKNLGLGEGSALPVGVPIPWPSEIAPDGWLKCNGATFSAALYPRLAQTYPSRKLPDLRGEFIRGWDDGRGVDSSRTLLSSQEDAIRNISGIIGNGGSDPYGIFFGGVTSGAFYNSNRTTLNYLQPNSGAVKDRADCVKFDASRVVPTASENRPRNIAFNFIVRAA